VKVLLQREVTGFALAPLPVVVPFTLLFGIILFSQPSDSASAIQAWLELVVVSYGTSLLVGVPVHVALRRLALRSLQAYLVATTLAVGAIATAVWLFQLMLPPSVQQNPHAFIITSRIGLTAILLLESVALTGASIFWLVSVRRVGAGTSGSHNATTAFD